MSALTGPALVVAALLALAGAQKVLDPTMTVGALRALRLPASASLVRLGSAAEVALGVGAITLGSPAVWWLVAASYLAFCVVVIAALRQGTMIGSCGCFGREETPPHWSHLGLNLCMGAIAATAALTDMAAPLDELRADGPGIALVLLAGIALYLVYALYVELPRAMVAGRPFRLGRSS